MSVTFRKLAIAVAALAVTASAIISCSTKKSEDPLAPEFSMDALELSYRSGSQFVSVNASGSWSFDIDFRGEDEWAFLSVPVGAGSIRSEVFRWNENPSTEPRSCIITL